MEYLQQGHVSEKTDTYAFGVVLCELLTGLPAADYDKGEWLATTMPDPLADAERLLPPLLDARLGGAREAAVVNLRLVDQGTVLRVARVAPPARAVASALTRYRAVCSSMTTKSPSAVTFHT